MVDEAEAGDIVLVNGIEDLHIGSTITDPSTPEGLPVLRIDEPTLTMNFMVNTSPLAGREGKFVTSRQIRDRLERELKSNVALRVRDTGDDTVFGSLGPWRTAPDHPAGEHASRGLRAGRVAPARGLQGNRRREMRAVRGADGRRRGRPPGRRDGRSWAAARGDLQDMQPDGRGRTRLEYVIPARGLIGFQNEFLTLTRGTGLMSHIFHEYAPLREGSIGERRNGVLISQDNGDAVAYALWKLQDRGRMFVSPASRCTKA